MAEVGVMPINLGEDKEDSLHAVLPRGRRGATITARAVGDDLPLRLALRHDSILDCRRYLNSPLKELPAVIDGLQNGVEVPEPRRFLIFGDPGFKEVDDLHTLIMLRYGDVGSVCLPAGCLGQGLSACVRVS